MKLLLATIFALGLASVASACPGADHAPVCDRFKPPRNGYDHRGNQWSREHDSIARSFGDRIWRRFCSCSKSDKMDRQRRANKRNRDANRNKPRRGRP